MKKESLFALMLLVLVTGVAIARPEFGWKLREFLSSSLHSPQKEEEVLKAENLRLKAQLAVLEPVAAQLPAKHDEYLAALVYTRYPFNFKSELLVSAGVRDGVEKERVAVFNGVFVGTVKNALEKTSVVQTVFNPRAQFSVRIGDDAAPALLRGGSPPRLALISLEADVQEGDVVYAVAENLPYGLPVGLVGQVVPSRDRLFNEATLKIDYDINSIVTLLIAK